MPVPAGAAAALIARLVAREAAKVAAKRGVKKLAASEMKQVVRKVAAQQGIKKVSAKDATDIARELKQVPGGARSPLKSTNLPKPSTKLTVRSGRTRQTVKLRPTPSTKKVTRPVTTRYQEVRQTPTDVRLQRIEERNRRIREGISPAYAGGKPVKPTKPVSKKSTSRTVAVAKSGPARRRNRVLIPRDSRIDESRRIAMREAEAASRYRQPTIESRTPRRPVEEVRELTRAERIAQREADKRVAEALKELRRREAARAAGKKYK